MGCGLGGAWQLLFYFGLFGVFVVLGLCCPLWFLPVLPFVVGGFFWGGGLARGRLACLNFGVVCRCPFGGFVCCGRYVGCGCDVLLWLVGVVGLSVGGRSSEALPAGGSVWLVVVVLPVRGWSWWSVCSG